MPIHGNTHVQEAGRTSLSAKLIHATTCAWSMGEAPRSCSLATAQEMALLSKMQHPSLVSKAGTLPNGNFLRKASLLLVSPKTKFLSKLTLAPLYWAATSTLKARKF